MIVISQSGAILKTCYTGISKSVWPFLNTLEDIVDERIHDAHSLAGDTSVGMDLLQDLVDVDGVTLTSLLPATSLAGWLATLAAFLEPLELTLGGMLMRVGVQVLNLNEGHSGG